MTDAQRATMAAQVQKREHRAWLLSEESKDAEASEIETRSKVVDAAEARAAALTATETAENGPDVTTGEGAEAREIRELEGRVEVRRYIGAAMDGGAVDGAEREYNQALGMGAGSFPLRLLAPEVETRATTDTSAGVTQGTWLDRLFADTAAMYLGVSFRSVRSGVQAYPTTTAGASAAQRGRKEAAADGVWTVSVAEVKPTRNAVRAVFSVEDSARLMGLEDALRRDLRMALTEGIDRAVFLGGSGANEDTADITGLQTHASVIEATLSQSNKVKPANTVALLAGLIDGQYAASPGDLRIVASVGANTLWMSTVANAAAENQTLAQFLRASGFGWRVRGGIETATAAGDYAAFVGLARGIEGSGVAPVWDSARLIRDELSGAARGEVAITLHSLWGFALPRPANFRRVKFTA